MDGSKKVRKSNRRRIRPNKRKNVFHLKTAEMDESSFGASAKKPKMQEEILLPRDSSVEYRILNFITVFGAISEYVKCKICDGNVKFQTASEVGLGFKILLLCDKCAVRNINSSPSDEHSYEINRRFLFVMRILGLGLKGAAKFCGLMDMPAFISQPTYDLIMNNIHSCVETATEKLFQQACIEEKNLTSEHQGVENSIKLTVSSDETWEKRGHASLFGVTSLIGYYSGKIIDIFVKSSHCKQCEGWIKKLNTEEYKDWYKGHQHDCSANHSSSPRKMGVDAVIELFERSVEKFGVVYKNYIKDSDYKTYSGILKAAPYGNEIVMKVECVGNVEKTMGTRLGYCIKRNGKLTGRIIDTLTAFYSLAIRKNCDSVEKMYNAIWAPYYHYCSTDKKPQHEKCPIGPESWCRWQRAVAANELSTFKHNYRPLPQDLAEDLLPIYKDLSNEELLERCVGGFTKNNDESFNQLIWKISPKIISPGSKIVEMAAYIAAGIFNEGTASLLYCMNAMGISLGPNAHSYAERENGQRVKISDHRAHENTIRQKLQLESVEATEGAEGSLYGSAMDDSI